MTHISFRIKQLVLVKPLAFCLVDYFCISGEENADHLTSSIAASVYMYSIFGGQELLHMTETSAKQVK